MSILEEFPKQPGDVQDYDFDFTDYVLSMEEAVDDAHTIDDVSVSGPDEELAIDAEPAAIYNGANLKGVPSTFIKVWTSGGTSGKKYKITARIATAGGRKYEAEIEIKVKET